MGFSLSFVLVKGDCRELFSSWRQTTSQVEKRVRQFLVLFLQIFVLMWVYIFERNRFIAEPFSSRYRSHDWNGILSPKLKVFKALTANLFLSVFGQTKRISRFRFGRRCLKFNVVGFYLQTSSWFADGSLIFNETL